MSSTISDASDVQIIQEVRRGRKESRVWDHFSKESLGSGHYLAKCHYCAQKWSRGRSEILKSHLALQCTEAPLSIKREYVEMLVTENTSTNKKHDSYNSSAEIDTNKKNEIDQALILF